jgi:peptide/nickel transport system substrate-binding protein
MIRKVVVSIMTLLVIASLVLSACTPGGEAGTDVVTLIWLEEFDTLNPLYTNMWFVTVMYPVYECQAWWFDENNEPVPSLVKEIPSLENGGISADQKTITFKLRDDIVWSDGKPITSADFKFTYDMTMSDKNAVSSRSPLDLVEKFETPDKSTVVVSFAEPYAPWLARLFAGQSGQAIIPEHILKPVFEKAGTLDTAEWNKAPTVGCGPFVFKEWESGGFARFVANSKYWLGKPKVDELFFRFVPDSASQVAALVAGDGDVGTFFDWSEVPELEKAGVKIVNSFSGFNEGIYFNLHPEKGNPVLKDLRVRKAIALAFNREKLVKDLLLGLTGVAATDWDNSPWIDPSVKPWPYDPEQAKALLDEAGWVDTNGDGTRDKDGVELVLKYGTTNREIRQNTQAVAQQDLAQVGVKLDLLSYEFDLFFMGYADDGPSANFSLDLIQYSDSPDFPDPNAVVWLCSEIPSDENPVGVSPTGLCDAELDGLFQKQATQVDFAERQKTMHQITKLIFDQVYWIGIWQDPDLFGFSSRLGNVRVSGATPFFNVAEWTLTK